MNNLTLREQLIAAALTGILSNQATQELFTDEAGPDPYPSIVPSLNAIEAITVADAVLAELAQQEAENEPINEE